jgi:hypothetical protein
MSKSKRYKNVQSTFIRSAKGYTMVGTTVFRSGLSITAIGLLAKLLSNTDTYAINKSVIERESGVGEITFNNAWAELEEKHFIKRERVGTGKFIYRWIVINDPVLVARNANNAENPQVDKKEENTTPEETKVKKNTQDTRPENPEEENQERKTSTGNPEVENQDWNISDGNVATNIDLSTLDENTLDINNIDLSTLDLSTVEQTIEEGTKVDVMEDLSNISNSIVNANGDIIKNNNSEGFINNSTSIQNSDFCYFDDAYEINESNFLDEIDFRKHLFLSYWYIRINPTPLTSEEFRLYNKHFKIISDLFRNCYYHLNLKLQPHRFLDTPIIDLLNLINKYLNENMREIEIPYHIFKNLKNDRFMLSKFIESLVEK